MDFASGKRSPSRLKPGWLGWDWRETSTSASTSVSRVTRQSLATAIIQRWPSASRNSGRSLAAATFTRRPKALSLPWPSLKRRLQSIADSRVPRSLTPSVTLVSSVVGRFTTRFTRPPGALVPAWMPLVPLSTSRLLLFARGRAVSALIGRPSRRKLKRLSRS